MSGVAVLFAREDSIYKTLPGVDVFDVKRDARSWRGGVPVVAHPPCRAWGRLRQFAKPRRDEKELALFAVDAVRKNGGVLEHPVGSTLWDVAGLPLPGRFDEFGGFTFPVYQSWFGHRADKSTLLYIVGVLPCDVPAVPLMLGRASHVLETTIKRGSPGWRPSVTKAEREHTPREFALWLVDVAGRCRV